MSHVEPIDITKETTQLGGSTGTLATAAGGIGVVLLVVAAVLGAAGVGGYTMQNFLRAYLIAFSYFLTIALGAMFFVLVHHLTRAGWSVVVRRLSELIMQTLPVLAIASLPILIGVNELYAAWVNPAAEIKHLVEAKGAWLNAPAFIGRIVFYFVLWSFLALVLFRRSVKQDESGDPKISLKNEALSAPGMLLFALSLSFAGMDLLMTLKPDWFSSIFGVYIFAGCVVSGMSYLALFGMYVQRKGALKNTITVEHYHDIGKLMYGFVVFWGYIAFSQYMLIWYANIPEEVSWFWPKATHAAHPSWLTLSYVLLFGHLIVPLLGLLSRHVKRFKPALAFWAVWLLVMHYIDLYWIVTPTFSHFAWVQGGVENEAIPFAQLPLDLLCLAGLGGIFKFAILRPATKVALVPVKDPRLDESQAFENF